METVSVTATAAPKLPRWALLSGYLAVLIAAESLIAYGDAVRGTGWQEAGLTLHILLVFALLFYGVLVYVRSPVFSSLLVSMSLVSLIRIYSLALPPFTFTVLQRLALVSAPLLVSIAAVAYVQRLRPRDLGLVPASWREVAIQAGIGLTGVPLGFLEYGILRPDPWIETLLPSSVLVGSVVIFLATGISEELIFRGILLRRAVEGLGPRAGLLFVSLAFTALHIFFRSATDLAFVFAVGLFYGYAVLWRKSLWGAVFSHTLGNVVLYLVAPFVLT